jgi:hypothetical protein
MSRIEVNSALGLGFENAVAPVAVFDENGNRLGRFIPEADPMEGCPYTEEELRQHHLEALANPEAGKSLAQFWREMGRTS